MLKHLLSSGTVNPAASVAMVPLPFLATPGRQGRHSSPVPVLFGSARPIAGLRLKDSLTTCLFWTGQSASGH